MKKFTLLFLLLGVSLTSSAQITINYVDFTLDITGDTLNLTALDENALSLPQAGTDMIWDYSNASITNNEAIVYESASNPDFPGSNVRSPITYNLIGYPVSLPTYRYMTFDAQGLRYDGYPEDYVPIPIGSITGNTPDTLFNLSGPRTQINPWSYINFPLNYNDSSVVNTTTDHNVLVDAAPFGLDDFPIIQRRFYTTTKNVTGWGKLVLTNPDTQLPDTIEVLLQERTAVSVDSFYSAGALTPDVLLGLMGLNQGVNSGNLTYHYFYTKGLNQYAMVFITNNNTGLTTRVIYNSEIFRDGLHVNTNSKKAAIVAHKVYPNPIQNQQFQLELEKNNAENWQLSILNILGQTVHEAFITENRSTIQLGTNLPSGQYFYTIKNEDGQIIANGKLINN